MDPLSCPTWFRGFSILFNIIFFFVTGAITITGFRAYMFSKKENMKLHSVGFGLLALSYFVLAVTNAVVFSRAGDIVSWMIGGFYLYTILFLAGIVVLLFVYLKVDQTKVRALILMITLAIVVIFNKPTSMSQGIIFFLLAAALIAFIVVHMAKHFRKVHHRCTLCILMGFSLLLVSQILFALEFLGTGFYIAAAVVMLSAYLFIGVSRLLL